MVTYPKTSTLTTGTLLSHAARSKKTRTSLLTVQGGDEENARPLSFAPTSDSEHRSRCCFGLVFVGFCCVLLLLRQFQQFSLLCAG